MVVVVHRGGRVERHQLQRLKVDAERAVLMTGASSTAAQRQLSAQRRPRAAAAA